MTAMFRPKRVSALVSLALLIASSASGSSRKPVPNPVPKSGPVSPVRCNVGEPIRASMPSARPLVKQAISPAPAPAIKQGQDVVVAETLRRVPMMRLPGYSPPPVSLNRERYEGKDVASVKAVANEPVSTFSVDVDTGSYANVRRFLTLGSLPPPAAVRTEEMLNYFRYNYPTPKTQAQPFGMTTDMAITPWNPETRLLRIGITGYDLPVKVRPAANLVFLVDVSGSMMEPDKLPLVKTALTMLANRLTPRDQVSIVVYAGAAGIVLEPTNKPHYIKAALDCLRAGGSTAGGAGMELAYATAKANFIKGGANRVIMATDGDFNVGISSTAGIEAIVKKNRDAGITLTTLGFGQGNFNEAMMEKMADIGNGNYAYIDSTFEAYKVLDDEMAATLFTIAKDVKIQIEFNPAVISEYRLIGYENRVLAEEDFNNDKVDAGDIGAGHQVTALYEVVPTGMKGWLPDRRYPDNQIAKRIDPSARSSARELAWLKLRYKMPDGDKSILVEEPVLASAIAAARPPVSDLAFVAAVAAYGQKLRGDKYLGYFSFADIRALAGQQKGYFREEFVKLTAIAQTLSDGENQAGNEGQ
jgi:Ca-activated chloride channel homolog